MNSSWWRGERDYFRFKILKSRNQCERIFTREKGIFFSDFILGIGTFCPRALTPRSQTPTLDPRNPLLLELHPLQKFFLFPVLFLSGGTCLELVSSKWEEFHKQHVHGYYGIIMALSSCLVIIGHMRHRWSFCWNVFFFLNSVSEHPFVFGGCPSLP